MCFVWNVVLLYIVTYKYIVVYVYVCFWMYDCVLAKELERTNLIYGTMILQLYLTCKAWTSIFPCSWAWSIVGRSKSSRPTLLSFAPVGVWTSLRRLLAIVFLLVVWPLWLSGLCGHWRWHFERSLFDDCAFCSPYVLGRIRRTFDKSAREKHVRWDLMGHLFHVVVLKLFSCIFECHVLFPFVISVFLWCGFRTWRTVARTKRIRRRML